MTWLPSAGALNPERLPWNRPSGLRSSGNNDDWIVDGIDRLLNMTLDIYMMIIM